MKISLYDYCIENGRAELLEQWDYEKNEISPDSVGYASHRKVWWRCDKGHSWLSEINPRVKGSGCPACANRVVIPGENDLATTHPEIAAQWHPTKNGAMTPQMVSRGGCKKVWWLCDKGHEWMAPIRSRTNGFDCPVCAGKTVISGENDLAYAYPIIAAQWHPTKNGTLRPDGVTPFSNRVVWWLCDKGHEYKSPINVRTGDGHGCPYCAGRKVLAGFNDLATIHPKIAAQWHPTMNGSLTPEMVTAGSNKKIWWICDEGHIWDAVIFSRTGPRKHGCPLCAGNVSQKRLERYNKILEDAKLQTGTSDKHESI